MRKGFTLIELIVVIGIIGILSLVVYMNVVGLEKHKDDSYKNICINTETKKEVNIKFCNQIIK